MTHVLVTRPLDASRQLAGELVKFGLFPVLMPLYTFTARQPGSDVHSAWSSGTSRKLAVFTSPRAVQYGLSNIPEDQLEDLEFAVVGSATATMLESAGFQVHLQAQSGYTSEDLLKMPALLADPGLAMIFCAPGGRETLAVGLQARGWRVVKAMVYERVPLKPESEQINILRNTADILSIWTSISSLKLAREYLPGEIWKKILKAPALVISTRIQHHLEQQGANRVELADGPGNFEILQSILSLTGKQTSS